MLHTTIIGHIGNDAEVKNVNGKEFTTFRVAHSDRWTDENGQSHDVTTWVDCVMNGKPAVLPYLTKGTMIFATGSTQLRVYSSPKDRCMKAGLTINVRTIELVGGKPDPIPSTLFRADDGSSVPISKHFFALSLIAPEREQEFIPLVSTGGKQFICDRNGNVSPFNDQQQ